MTLSTLKDLLALPPEAQRFVIERDVLGRLVELAEKAKAFKVAFDGDDANTLNAAERELLAALARLES